MSDIYTRAFRLGCDNCSKKDATITALEARVRELEGALKPFASIGQMMLPSDPTDDSAWATVPDKTPVRSLMGHGMKFGDFRTAARTALGEKP